MGWRAAPFWPAKLVGQADQAAAGSRVRNSNPARPFLGGPSPFCHPYYSHHITHYPLYESKLLSKCQDNIQSIPESIHSLKKKHA